MTSRVIINGCLEQGCENDGGHSLLCPDHAPAFDLQAALSGLARAKVAAQARAIEMIIKGEIVP